jgi:NitT/TauT family transport system substrate-binding protein
LLVLGVGGCAPGAAPAAPPATAPAVTGGSGAAAATTAPAPAQPAELERINLTTSDPTVTFGPLYVGIGKGFFREEGLDAQAQVVTPSLSLAALANNQDVDYQTTIGTVVRGAATGAPVRVAGIWFEKTAFFLMARPEIRSVADLRGKVLAVTTFGSTGDVAMRLALREAGIDAETETTTIQTGPGHTRILTIQQGGAAASMFTPPDNAIAEQHGLHRIPSFTEALPVPFTGIGVSERRLQENPAQVERVLRATLKTLRFMRDQPREASDIIADATNVDRETTFAAYQSLIGTLSPDGWASAEALENMLQQSLAPGATAPPESAVFDPRALKAAQRAQNIAGRP